VYTKITVTIYKIKLLYKRGLIILLFVLFKNQILIIKEMIFKYWTDDKKNVHLEKHKMVDISNDMRTMMLNKAILTSKLYKIDTNIFFIKQEFFIYMANIIDQPNAKSLYIKYDDGKQVIISGDKALLFYNGISIEPNEYILPISKDTIQSMFGM
jgi:hypothetical protein